MLAISIPAILLIDRFTRRTVTMTGGLLLTACMFIIGALYASDSVHPSAGAGRFLVVALVFVFGLSYCATWGIVGKIYASEIQPAATRGPANCVAQGLGFFTNFVVAVLTPVLLARSDFAAYFLFGGFCCASLAVLFVYMPETKGMSLEAIEEAFVTRPVGGRGAEIAGSIVRRFRGRAGRARQVQSTAGGAGDGEVDAGLDTAGTSGIEMVDVVGTERS